MSELDQADQAIDDALQPHSAIRPTRRPKLRLDEVGRTDAVCPNCGSVIDAFPAKKKKCIECGFDIFVRTRPVDGRRALLAAQDVSTMDEQWSLFRDSKIYSRLEESEVMRCHDELLVKFGSEPSYFDMAWRFLAKKSLRHSLSRAMGLYRNVQLDRAALLEMEGRVSQSLFFYFKVVYLDLNGAANTSRSNLDIAPKFDSRFAFVAPLVWRVILRIIAPEKLSEPEVQRRFLTAAEQEYRSTGAPLEPQAVWPLLAAAIYEGASVEPAIAAGQAFPADVRARLKGVLSI